jgi:hypothetical protein
MCYCILLLLYYFNKIGLQVSPTYKSQRRRISLISRYVPCNITLMDLFLFFNFNAETWPLWKIYSFPCDSTLNKFFCIFITGLFLCPLSKDLTQNILGYAKRDRLRKSFILLIYTNHNVKRKYHQNFGFLGLAVSHAELRKPKLYITYRSQKLIDRSAVTHILQLRFGYPCQYTGYIRPIMIRDIKIFCGESRNLFRKHCFQGLTMYIRPCRC